MSFYYDINPQTIFVQDDKGLMFSVPLITANTVRQVLRCHIRNDVYRLKLEMALLRKYFPLSIDPEPELIVPSSPAVRVPFSPSMEVIVPDNFSSDSLEVGEKTKRNLDLVVEPSIESDKKKAKQEVVDSVLSKDNDIEDEETLVLPVTPQDSTTGQEEEETVVEDVVNSDIRQWRAKPVFRSCQKERKIVLKQGQTVEEIPIFEGALKGLRCYHIDKIRVDLEGVFETGKLLVKKKKDATLKTSWLDYHTVRFSHNLNNTTYIVVSNDKDPPKEIDINAQLIRQLKLLLMINGEKGKVIKVKIKVEARLLSMAYSHARRLK